MRSTSPGRLELLAEPPASLAWPRPAGRAMRVQVLAAIQPGTFTHRLRYRWRWTELLRTRPGRPRTALDVEQLERAADSAEARASRALPRGRGDDVVAPWRTASAAR